MDKHEDDTTERCDPEPDLPKRVESRPPLDSRLKEVRKSRPLTLFKEDLSHFKENLLNALKDKDGRTTRQDTKSSVSALTLLREDLSQLKEDVSSVFRLGLHKDGVSKIRVASEGETETVENEEAEKSKEDQWWDGVMSEDDLTVSAVDIQESSCAQPRQEQSPTVAVEPEGGSDQVGLSSAQLSAENGRTSQEPEEPEGSLCEPLSSHLSLLVSRDTQKCDTRAQLESDPWCLKNFACYLTLDPNTANSELELSDCNRKATRVWSDLRPCHHPDRFRFCPQVLCREGLLDNMYWEVEWSGGADIGVTYNSISRSGDVASCLLGHNERSWSLECQEGSYTASHNNTRVGSSTPQPFSHRVGVFLNWSDGSLSFYCVSPDTMTHLHTFSSTFTEPLYPGFWVWAYDGSVTLCQVEMNWERLLQ
ncbi:E3 ubiquitin-protein ligase TRIM11-like [Synchiropus splendidus]|uniref:E3 ubiquitin-protein ligase TRIM11-like n=1 Tax=Synchiropus splendidus TaxID=270530 RepID=UPI00237D902F|nr:E3 ubiquitin-protein ligase TRIM11-like [Synchiropus splendidus]